LQRCKIRLCIIERGFANCSACPDYACEQLMAFFQMAPQAQATLEAIRKALAETPARNIKYQRILTVNNGHCLW